VASGPASVEHDPLDLFAPESAGSGHRASMSPPSTGDDEVTVWAFEEGAFSRLVRKPTVDLPALGMPEAVEATPRVSTPVNERGLFPPKRFVRGIALGSSLAAAGVVAAAIFLAWPRPIAERRTALAPAVPMPQERRVAALLASRPILQRRRLMGPLPGAALGRGRLSLRSLSMSDRRSTTEPARPGNATEQTRRAPEARSAAPGQDGIVAAVDPTSIARPMLPSAPPPTPSSPSQLALADASSGAAATNSIVPAVVPDTGPPVRMPAAAPASNPPETLSTSNRGNEVAIQSVLGRYQSALSARNAGAAKEVWPTVDVKALGRALDRLAEQRVEFATCQIVVTDPRALALCRGTARYIPTVGNKTMRYESREWRFALRKRDQSWVIEGVESR
jgi:hypothetical protein